MRFLHFSLFKNKKGEREKKKKEEDEKLIIKNKLKVYMRHAPPQWNDHFLGVLLRLEDLVCAASMQTLQMLVCVLYISIFFCLSLFNLVSKSIMNF